MRRKIKKIDRVVPDRVYNSVKLSRFINRIMLSGKKNTAERIVYNSLDTIKEKTKGNPMDVFNNAIKNTTPTMEVRSRRIGGANYQVPREVRPERKLMLSMKWIIDAARARKGSLIHLGLADELISASNNEGVAVKKKEDTHKMAESNKAFAHFSW